MHSPEYGIGGRTDTLSGFNIGINGSNKLYVETVKTTNEETGNQKEINTFSRTLSDQSLVSITLSQDTNYLSFGLHYPNEKYNEIHEIHESKPSYDWHLGGFVKGTYGSDGEGDLLKNEDINYSGILNNFMLFYPSLTPEQENNFSDYFFISDYTGTQVIQRELQTKYKSINPTIQTGIIGTGITGYENILLKSIANLDGSPTHIYFASGVTGATTGQFVSYEESPETITTYTDYLAPEEFLFEERDFTKYSQKRIRFLKSLESGFAETQSGFLPTGGFLYSNHNLSHDHIQRDTLNEYEVYSSKNPSLKLNRYPKWFGNSGMFSLGEAYNGKPINLYRNGILQKSGTYNEVAGNETPSYGSYVNTWNINSDGVNRPDYTIIDENKIWSNQNYSSEDYLTYEIVDEDIFVSGFINTPGTNTTIGGENEGKFLFLDLEEWNLTGRDIYFGGIKLISGTDKDYYWDDSVGQTVVIAKKLSNGEFAFVKQAPMQWSKDGGVLKTHSDKYNQVGTVSGTIEVEPHMENYSLTEFTNEIVWVSGIRQQRNIDYIKTESHSLLTSKYDYNSGVIDTIIHSGQSGFWNFWTGEHISYSDDYS